MARLFALVDCNNFYCSCERAFVPALEGRPVVVLSNNDGCVIARSQEAKDLGIAMGEPAFKREAFYQKHGVEVQSSNYALYTDMSQRVVQTLLHFSAAVEVYSIDEAFLAWEAHPGRDITALGTDIRRTVRKWTHLPVSVGVATSKTLAKLANRHAKKHPECQGVMDLTSLSPRQLDAFLDKVAVEDVWGIGRKLSLHLKTHDIFTARQLRDAPKEWVRKTMTVGGLHTVLELQGTSCIELEEAPPPKKAILTSRSFGKAVSTLPEVQEAVAAYVSRVGEKLRRQGSRAGRLQVFVMTNPHKDVPQYANALQMALSPSTAHTPALIAAAQHLMRKLYREGYIYKKAGVMVTELEPETPRQLSLLEPAPEVQAKQQALMAALDTANAKWGRGTLSYAAAGLERPWRMRQASVSPRFTTDWEHLPKVRM